CGEPGQKLEGTIAQVTEEFITRGDFTVFAIDVHEKGDPLHPETKLFPPHNIRGTKGRALYGKLDAIYQKHKEATNLYYMDKTRYSAFAGTDLEIKLKERAINEIHIV